jgi:hypothetical protein
MYRVHETPVLVKSFSLVPGCSRGGTYDICAQQDRVPDRTISRVILRRETQSANLTFVHGAMRVLARDLEAALFVGAQGGAPRAFDILFSTDVVVNPGSGAEEPTPE